MKQALPSPIVSVTCSKWHIINAHLLVLGAQLLD
jgi:hypothetical protein